MNAQARLMKPYMRAHIQRTLRRIEHLQTVDYVYGK